MRTTPANTATFTVLASRAADALGTDNKGNGLEVALLADDRILLTVPDAARRLGISRSLLYELLADGAVDSIRIGRLRRVPADALARFVDAKRAGFRPDSSGSA